MDFVFVLACLSLEISGGAGVDPSAGDGGDSGDSGGDDGCVGGFVGGDGGYVGGDPGGDVERG